MTIIIEFQKKLTGHRINRANLQRQGKSMESTQEATFKLKCNRGNISEKIHMNPIQGKHAGVERLL